MKKTILLALLMLGSTSVAFAANTTITQSTGTSIGSTEFRPSQGVSIVATATDVTYSVATKHLAGDKKFTADNASAVITELDATKGQIINTATGTEAAPAS